MRRIALACLLVAGCATLETADQQLARLSRECAAAGVPYSHPNHELCVRDFAALEAGYHASRSRAVSEGIDRQRSTQTQCYEALGKVTCTTR